MVPDPRPRRGGALRNPAHPGRPDEPARGLGGRRARKELAKEIENGAMPPAPYVAAHPEAKLSGADKALLAAWARGL